MKIIPVSFKIVFFVFIAFFSVLTYRGWAESTPAPAAEEPKGEASDEQWRIQADRLTFHHASDTVVAEGGVRVRRGDLKIESDWIHYDRRRLKARAEGAVVIHLGEDVLRGSDGELDLRTATGTIRNAHLFLRRNNVHLSAAELTKIGPEEYKAREAVISTCAGPKPAWSFACRKLKLTVVGLAVATHSTFEVKDVPVLYSPWVVLPINRYRKTGFLLPDFASSRRNGAEINVPFFWAINDSLDATFYQHPMARRGWMEGMEFRYTLSEATRGVIRYNILDDRLDDDDYNEDGQVRGNERRWWLRAKADQRLPWGFEAKVDLDLMSDRDYLQEFDDGPMGYDETRNVFLKGFGRTLTDDTDFIRPSTAQITRSTANSFLAGEVRYNDFVGLEVPDGDTQDTMVQTFPRFVFNGFRQRLFSTPFYYDWQTSYVHYWREEGVRAQRIDLRPRASLPVSLGGFAHLLLSGAIEETAYQVSGEDPTERPESSPDRLLYDLEADLSTTFGRTFRLASGREIRHTLRPRVTYQYRPPENQDDIPEIDVLDRLEPTNRVTWSLLSFASSKARRGAGRYAYSDTFRFRIEQSYDIRESIRDLQLGVNRHPFSDIYAELELSTTPYFYLRYDTTYSLYGEGFTTYNLAGHFSSPAGDRLDLYYRYNRETEINQFNLDLSVVLTPAWFATYHMRRSLAKSSELESHYGLRYQSGCWAIEGRFMRDPNETRWTFHVELLGIGGWGGR